MASKPSSSSFLLCFLVVILQITVGANQTALAAPSGSLRDDPLLAGGSFSPVGCSPHDHGFECDKIDALPGQPKNTDFNQYSGYVTVDQKAGRALFYYLVESPDNSAKKPLVLWLNGGPGCSSLIGAMIELGPFRVNRDGKTLSRNLHSWNNVANVIFVETPAGVGFSYSNTSDSNSTGDRRTIIDTYTFLTNWYERFPHYQNRDFFITGESYAGLIIPELAATILHNNKATDQNAINLKGIAMGNALVDFDDHSYYETYEFCRNHAMISEETYAEILKTCSYRSGGPQLAYGPCQHAVAQAVNESGLYRMNEFNIYAPTCRRKSVVPMITSGNTIANFDPCMENYVTTYLNKPAVQDVMHANVTKLQYPWKKCMRLIFPWEGANTSLPTIKRLIISDGIRILLYSGDLDSKIPTSATERAIKKLKLSVVTDSWTPWYFKNEVAGYRVRHGRLTFMTIRGAGHMVPRDQPERALRMITSFLRNKFP